MPEMLFKVPGSWSASAHVDDTKYHEMYAKSVRDPESFWASTASVSTGSSLTPARSARRLRPTRSQLNGSATTPPTYRSTASVAIWPSAPIRPPSFGRVIDPNKLERASLTARLLPPLAATTISTVLQK